MPSLVEIDPVVLVKKMKMQKAYDNNDANDDNDSDDGQRTRANFDHKRSFEPSTSGELKGRF